MRSPELISGATRLAGVIGDPVRHSLSPAIHNAAYAAHGLDWAYVALPVRPGDTGPNIVEFALATKHAPGVQMYKRSGMSIRGADAACAKFPSPDQAQQDFLAKGGPDRDRMGVDPDGDGFACSWDPRPFRTALQ